jgi:pimeloyl-ACP methyl ester carboxylesterase
MSALLRLVLRGERRAKLLGLLEENLREHEEVGRLDDSYPAYSEVTADVLLLSGGKSGSWVHPAYDRLTEVLQSSQIRTFPKLDHFGPEKGADVIAAAVTAHLVG